MKPPAAQAQSQPPKQEAAPDKGKGPGRPRKIEKAKPDSKAAAQSLIELVQLFTVTKFGPTAEFTPTELYMIQPSLERLIDRYGSVADQFGGFIDPALLLVGIGIYAIRLNAASKEQAQAQAAANLAAQGFGPAEQPPEPPAVTAPISDMFGGVFGGMRDQ